MGGGQDAQATVSSPPGVKIIRVGVKIPREILTPGGQAARGYLDPPGVKLPRGQDKPVHRNQAAAACSFLYFFSFLSNVKNFCRTFLRNCEAYKVYT